MHVSGVKNGVGEMWHHGSLAFLVLLIYLTPVHGSWSELRRHERIRMFAYVSVLTKDIFWF